MTRNWALHKLDLWHGGCLQLGLSINTTFDLANLPDYWVLLLNYSSYTPPINGQAINFTLNGTSLYALLFSLLLRPVCNIHSVFLLKLSHAQVRLEPAMTQLPDTHDLADSELTRAG